MIFRNYVYPIKNKGLIERIAEDRDNLRYRPAYAGVINDMNKKLDEAYVETSKTMFAFVYDVDTFNNTMSVCLAYEADKCELNDCEEVLNKVIGTNKYLKSEEITIHRFSEGLDKASTREYLNYSINNAKNRLGINVSGKISMFAAPVYEYSEDIYNGKLPSKKESLEKAEKILASKSFIDEINRIYSNQNSKEYYGHPVHYYITAGSWGAAQDMIDVLVPALLKNNRLLSKRTAYIKKIQANAYGEENFENVFSSAINSTIVVDFSGERSVRNYATGYQRNAEIIGKKLKECGNSALFIFVEISSNIIYRDEVLGNILANGDIIKIDEGFGDHDRALRYLNDLVDRSKFSDYKEKDMDKYLPDKISFSVSDVYEAYETWYGQGLRNHIYKAYKNVEKVKIKIKKPEAKPYEKLQELIGLTQIKKLIDQVITFNKVQSYRKEMGLSEIQQTRHMLFYGNPGTAKTTVARLLSQILKEEGVLENGHVIECGRQDLVGLYVGWTAKIVKEKFESAKGGILFIDEAYSLVDGSNSFGDEAINTIVQCMENYRDEVIVILAGYPDKMRDFIEKNEGLASRIAFQLDFPDYDNNELLQIMELMLKEHKYKMSEQAKAKCAEVFKQTSNIKNFGNGRFVRNFLEQVELKQAERIAKDLDNETIDKDVISKIEVDDILDDYKFLVKETKEENLIGY